VAPAASTDGSGAPVEGVVTSGRASSLASERRITVHFATRCTTSAPIVIHATA